MKRSLVIIVVVMLLGLSTTGDAFGSYFSDDFNDGDANGWTADFRTQPVGTITLPSREGMGNVLRFEGECLWLWKDGFTFPGNQYVVEYDARLVQEAPSGGSDGIGWIQYNAPFDDRQISRRANEYNDVLMHDWEFGQRYFSLPSTPITEWTRYRTVRTGDLYEVLYKLPTDADWTSLGTLTTPTGTFASGGQFAIILGGPPSTAIYEIDNVSVTPEPATVLMFVLGGLGLLRRRWA